MRMGRIVAGCLLLAAVQVQSACGQTPRETPNASASAAPATTASAETAMRADDDARRFVQEFFDWYAAYSRRATGAAWDSVEVERPGTLGDDLVRALRVDAEGRAGREGEAAGLDFDPFLAAQDPCEHYEARAVETKGEAIHVAMHGTCADAREPGPDVVAVVTRHDGRWRIVNFRYPDSDADLLGVLAELKQMRDNPPPPDAS